jgi:hypothetical protein
MRTRDLRHELQVLNQPADRTALEFGSRPIDGVSVEDSPSQIADPLFV